MRAFRKSLGISLAVLLMAGLFAGQAMAAPVALELALLVDVSGSVSAAEYTLQKTGYINAFNDPTIQAAIASFAASGGIAVTYVEWSANNQQSTQVGWTQITNAAEAAAFASAIGGTTRAYNGNTAPGDAIEYGIGLFANNFEGTRKVIDVSGDGASNAEPTPYGNAGNAAHWAAAALASGITVNGLAILGESGLQAWYQNNIVTPGGGSLYIAATFDDFEGAVAQKIGQEITPIPEPGTMMLLGSGLVGLAGWGRKKFRL